MSQAQGPLIEARPKGQLEPRLSPRARRLIELLVEHEFQARRPAKPKRPRKGETATEPQPEPAQAPTIASLSVAAGYADTASGYAAARRDVAAPQARAYRAQLRHMALDDSMGAIVGNIASIAMGNSTSDKAQIEAFAQLVAYQQASVPKGQQAVMTVDYEVEEAEAYHDVHTTQGPEADPPQDDPGPGKAGGSVGAGSARKSDLAMVTLLPPELPGMVPHPGGWMVREDAFPPGPALAEADVVTILRGAGYEVVEGAEAVLAAVNGEVRPDDE